ncbi:MAG TPA: hypothetical protein VFV33_14610, partial [Gemmatimonadaceae bacterium]|nr:hypothetical protein [Gemmatimonadaceae bacterium]
MAAVALARAGPLGAQQRDSTARRAKGDSLRADSLRADSLRIADSLAIARELERDSARKPPS